MRKTVFELSFMKNEQEVFVLWAPRSGSCSGAARHFGGGYCYRYDHVDHFDRYPVPMTAMMCRIESPFELCCCTSSSKSNHRYG